MREFFHSISFIFAISVTGIYSWLHTSTDSIQPSIADLLSGNAAQQFEANYEMALPIRELGINLWSAASYLFLRDGDEELIVGENGWLFTAEEFYAPETAATNIDNNLQTIASVHDMLAARGTQLVIVPLPSKARVHSEWSKRTPVSAHQTLYANTIDYFESRSINYIDVLELFDTGSIDRFLKSDTHWLPESAALTAAALAERFGQPSSEQHFAVGQVSTTNVSGDLNNFLPLQPWFKAIAPPQEQLSVIQVVSTDSEQSLFGDIAAPEVALIGTSYSANEKWNFEGSLKLFLNEDLINFAQEGEGPIEPMLQFIESYLDQLDSLRLVVWEIPERYLVQPYRSYQPRSNTLTPGLQLAAQD